MWYSPNFSSNCRLNVCSNSRHASGGRYVIGKVVSMNARSGEERKDSAVPFDLVDLIDLKPTIKSKVVSPESVKETLLGSNCEAS
jgi:hypothetical protein